MFQITLQQMLTMFAFISLGFILRKTKILPENSDVTMARLETYIFVPALSLASQMNHCTVKTFTENAPLILYGAVIVVIALALSFPLSALFVKKTHTNELIYQRKIYQYAMTFGNYGFMGNFIVLGVWGSEFLFKYQMFCFIVGILCSSWGLYILIPKDRNASILQNLKKGLLAPPMCALFIGILVGLLNLRQYVPDFLMKLFSDAGNCQGPVAMVLAGFVIGGYNLKDLLFNKKVYVASLLRLIVIPAVLMVILKLLGTPEEIMILALICFAAPLGLNTIVYPATYGGETKTGAAMASISHTASVITIPLMYYLFIELL